MARLRLRIEINPGGAGVRLRKLADISDELEKFVRYLADDLGISADNTDWVAHHFYDGSVGCTVELPRPVTDRDVAQYNGAVDRLVYFREETDVPDSDLTGKTLKQFVVLGHKLEPDENLRVGLFSNGGDEPEWRNLARRPALELERVLETPFIYEGSVQGKTGTWYKGSDYFDLRDIHSSQTIKCHYGKEMYGAVAKAYEDRDAVIHVSGTVKASRLEKRPFEVRNSALQVFAPLTDEEFRNFYGIAPEMTGDESSSDFISRRRTDGDA